MQSLSDDVVVQRGKLIPASILIQVRLVGLDVDGLFDSPLKPLRLHRQDVSVLQVDGMSWAVCVNVLRHL